MALKSTKFYRRFQVRVIVTALAVQLVVGLLSIVWYVNLPALGIDRSSFMLALLGPFLLLETIGILFTIGLLIEPIKIITDAILQASGQAGNAAPPNVTNQRYEKNGLSSLVQDVYALSATAKEKGAIPADDREEMLERILDMLPVGIIMADAEGNIIHANTKAPLRHDGTTLSALNIQFDQDDFTSWLQACQTNAIATDRTWTRVHTQGDKDRKFYDLLASYHKAGSHGIETVLLAVDRTADYGPTEESMDFIALAAHELRGPITVIRGYLEVLSDELGDTLSDDHKVLMDRLNVSAHRLSGYINNILNASRYDRRHLKLHLQEFKVDDLYKSLEADLQLRARTSKKLLAISLPHDLPTVAADKNSIEEVITNLIDNGIKYSREGGQVSLSAKTEGDFVEFSVQDHGIGIPASLIPNLFTKFYRSHRSRETVSGTGLGLYLAKAIVESHGGTMSVRSTEGQGSTFTFSLPIYSTVADKLLASNNKNETIIESSNGWIRNHAMYRG